jgi:sec-independent protein translocase protein TatA
VISTAFRDVHIIENRRRDVVAGKESIMFGGHIWELAIVVVLALIVFGPKRLPEIGGAMGKGIREFKKGTQELQDSFSSESETTTQVRSTAPRQAEPTHVVKEDETVVHTTTADREAS